MQDVNVVVLFHSSLGSTERLALAAAVGAVQGRANIRLRRLSDAVHGALFHALPGWKESRARMEQEYIPPRDEDATWADAIVAGMPGGMTLSPAFQRYFDSLRGLRDQGSLEWKIGAAFTRGLGADPLYAAIHEAGLMPVPFLPDGDALVAAQAQGRKVAEAARSLRAVRGGV
jgi:hypothetical protein